MSSAETVMMSPKQAKVLRETATFSLQRPMNAVNVARLRAEMDAGRFVPGTPIYFATLPDGAMLALNGQHTLEAVSLGTNDIELTMIFQPVKNAVEAGIIYARLDLHKIRSWRDSMRAYGAESMLSDSTVWTAAYAAALGQIFQKFQNVSRRDRVDDLVMIQATRSRDVRVRVMRELKETADLYVAAIGSIAREKTFFKRAAVMGVGIEIIRYQPSAGSEFWASAAKDDGLKVGDPQRTLLHYLRNSVAAASHVAAGRDQDARAVALAWNAFFEKRRLEILRPAAMGEFRLAGTPWNGAFDPIEAYLPDLIRKQKVASPSLRKRIQTGVDAYGKPVAIHA
jgi:hypothetical protein